ncbi:MAG TPA: hypothetical protein VIX11_11020 [Candidatus Acidoferrum sp.]
MSRLFCAVARGDVKPKVASTLAYLAQTMLQSIPIAQHEYIESFDPDTWRSTVRSSFRHDDPEDFCKNVSLPPFVTKFNDLFDQAKRGKPDPNWDFEPDNVTAKKGGQIVVVNQGGEPHTFTEVKQFGGGFIGDLNGGEPTVSECSEGFKNLAVARTRILQGSQLQVNGLSQGEHRFQCCIHPWMRRDSRRERPRPRSPTVIQ